MPHDIDALVRELTLEEKCTLLAGAGLWSTVAVPRLGIPAVLLTDGPNGARGPTLPGATNDPSSSSICVPCGAALGATWDVALVERVGALIGSEARRKACRVLLAPTVNLHRSPLGGRNFESYSEDPVLAGRIASAFVEGAQSRGVACTVKHFAGNESETDRFIANTEVDERTLRELYLVPFEMAVRDGGALGIMTAYNRLNGKHCSDSAWLLRDVLRDEWGFDGFVVSDWFALATTSDSISAGLDLEMPGPGRAYGSALLAAVTSGDVDVSLVDAAVRRLLTVFDRIGALDDEPAHPSTPQLDQERALARTAASDSMVLLKNDGVLPLDSSRIRSLAVIGPNAIRGVIMGGGSASLPVREPRAPLAALRERLGDGVHIHHVAGVDISRTTPEIPTAWLSTPAGEPGMRVALYAGDAPTGDVVGELDVATGSAVWFGGPPIPLEGEFSFRALTTLRVESPGRWVLSLVQTGPSQLLLDGEMVIDGTVDGLEPGPEFFGMASRELTFEVPLSPDRPVQLEVRAKPGVRLARGVKLGLRPAAPRDDIARAVAAAASSDATIVIVGTDHQWEGEGGDRSSMLLPGSQDELVRRVLAVAPNAIIVCNTGAPVAMPWRAEARALLQIWFGGEGMADALVDVLFGDTEPGGRLPTTIPLALEDNPSFGNFPASEGRVRYGEGLLIGYRWYEKRRLPVAFAFGHGLSYTRFAFGDPQVSSTTFAIGARLQVTVPVTNVGDRAGKEVVQLYVASLDAPVSRPEKELRAFAAVRLSAGETRNVVFDLDERAFARWADPEPGLASELARLGTSVPWVPAPVAAPPRGWYLDPGRYELRVGRSSADIAHVVVVEVPAGGPLGARGRRPDDKGESVFS